MVARRRRADDAGALKCHNVAWNFSKFFSFDGGGLLESVVVISPLTMCDIDDVDDDDDVVVVVSSSRRCYHETHFPSGPPKSKSMSSLHVSRHFVVVEIHLLFS